LSLRISLSSDATRDALYAVLQELADKVDEGSASYADLMLKIRVAANVAETLADLGRRTGTNVNVRDV
jgi:hypothetical protein